MKEGLGYIIWGAFLFLLRYIPLRGIFEDESISLEGAVSLCNSFIGYFMERCNWLKPLDIIVIMASIGFVLYGFIQYIKSKDTAKKARNKIK